jgi:hypothetical protein
MKIKLPQADGVIRVTVTLPTGIIVGSSLAELKFIDLPIPPEDEKRAHILIQTIGANGQPNGVLSVVLQEPEPGSYVIGTMAEVAVHEVALKPDQTLPSKKKF